jgi:hypothetical protein
VSALRAIHDLLRPGGQLLILDRARERSLLTVLWQYAHRFLIPRQRALQQHDRDRGHAGAGRVRERRVLARLKKVLWKNKLYTSLALIRGTRPDATGPA